MKVTAISAAFAAVMGSAVAADGLYVSGSLSGNSLGHEIDRNTVPDDFDPAAGTPPPSSFVTRSEDEGVGFGLAVGYERSINSSFYWGAEAFYNTTDVRPVSLKSILRSITPIHLHHLPERGATRTQRFHTVSVRRLL